ncbi:MULTISPECIES: hypothetical protein [Pseudomonas aeruginosa group]|uniref:Uncharacterized protein n=1 Tax=Pseudomonas aeruginosa TaxID=287 RepID=A0ABD7JX80_PSEAI|nr:MULTISPECIES: hypothetical protein [Pseudomonas aeruginosa group]MBH8715844.1 hypothetical protein [Pseudomonas aeruginosa]MBH9344188.1 hypothetical protein [Pseudomonas aeruginosa]MBH9394710.1 hypothetical protein [Pseudomonas aeruginosa]MBI8116502.1 hypothetical protein [Pseudomonas aeruginosa]RTR92740.1 hypothetical protein DY932_25595 [Pseudomonas paraeruginosa]
MPQLIGQARRDFLLQIMLTIHSRGYQYAPQIKGYALGSPVPAAGSRMNCEGAALLMKELAMSHAPAGAFASDQLRVVRYRTSNRMLFPWQPQMKFALGAPHPNHVLNVGWVFENHFRLRDCGDGNRLYDPTFCTTTGNNYDAIEGSTQPLVTQNGQVIAEVFGEKHLVVTQGQTRDLFQISNSPLNNRYIIQDSSYV